MATFSAEHALPVDVIGARQAADPLTGLEAIAVAFQPDDGGAPQVLSLSICGAYELREVLDAALEAPFHWDDDEDPADDLLALALPVGDGFSDGEVVDLVRRRSVRWDETWASSHPR